MTRVYIRREDKHRHLTLWYAIQEVQDGIEWTTTERLYAVRTGHILHVDEGETEWSFVDLVEATHGGCVDDFIAASEFRVRRSLRADYSKRRGIIELGRIDVR